jgi:hypothetical protein
MHLQTLTLYLAILLQKIPRRIAVHLQHPDMHVSPQCSLTTVARADVRIIEFGSCTLISSSHVAEILLQAQPPTILQV